MSVVLSAPGSAGLVLVGGVALLRPEEQVFTAMLDGWRQQQLARNLALATADNRVRAVRAFAAHADSYPWLWTPQLVDEWCTDLRAVRGLRRSTVRNYQEALRVFCHYLTDPGYGWAANFGWSRSLVQPAQDQRSRRPGQAAAAPWTVVPVDQGARSTCSDQARWTSGPLVQRHWTSHVCR